MSEADGVQRSGKPAAKGYRRDVDGLRAVAIVAVVGFHSGLPFLSGGFVGVDVFFVISGFLITGLLVKEATTTGSIRLGAFYARRVRRLLPALACTVLGVLLLGIAFLLPWGEQQRLAQSALATAAFSSNFYFWAVAGDYFAAPVEREPLLHTWSLAVEEQFYFLWPLVLLGSHRLARRIDRPPGQVLAWLLGITMVVSLGACVTVAGSAPATAFYLVPFRAWEFALGGLLSLSGWQPGPRAAAALGAAGLAAIALSSVLLGHSVPFPGWAALAPTLGTVAVIAAGGAAVTTRWLAREPMVRVGQWSYSWYLWHWPLIATARAVTLSGPDPLRDGALSLLGLALSAASHRFVETPVRVGMAGPFRHQRGTLIAGATISVTVAVLAGLLGLRARQEVRTGQPYRLLTTALRSDPVHRPCHIEGGCRSSAWGRGRGVLLWGDSHAVALAPTLGAETPVIERSLIGCAPLLGEVVWEGEDGRPYEACRRFNENVAGQVVELARGRELSGVLLVARWPSYVERRSVAGVALMRPAGGEDPARSLERGLRATVERVIAAGMRVAVVGPLPEHAQDIPLCLLRRAPDDCATARHVADDFRREAQARLTAALSGHQEARLFDVFDALCPESSCPAGTLERPLYRDAHHVSAAGRDKLRSGFAAILDWVDGESTVGFTRFGPAGRLRVSR